LPIILTVPRATTHLELAIELGSDPITGSVSHGASRSQAFSGWIELVAAIEAARQSGARVGGSGEAGVKTLGSVPGANGSVAVVSYPSTHD
jgi:hypothetical protein